jgi:ankyrin repeat domain-containing protein 50
LQLDSLECCRTPEDVYECLESLPEGLDETYDRILLKIKGGDSKWAVKALQCLTFSARQMTLKEVADVIAFNPDSGLHDEKLPNPLAVLDICSSLVTISSGGVKATTKLKGKSEHSMDREIV